MSYEQRGQFQCALASEWQVTKEGKMISLTERIWYYYVRIVFI